MITTGNPRFEKNLHSSGKIPGKIRSLRHFPPADPVRGRLCAAPVRVRISRWRALPRMPPGNTASPDAPSAQNGQSMRHRLPRKRLKSHRVQGSAAQFSPRIPRSHRAQGSPAQFSPRIPRSHRAQGSAAQFSPRMPKSHRAQGSQAQFSPRRPKSHRAR